LGGSSLREPQFMLLGQLSQGGWHERVSWSDGRDDKLTRNPVGKLERKRLLERPRRTWDNDNKMDNRKTGLGDAA